jgi:hypothetical protein
MKTKNSSAKLTLLPTLDRGKLLKASDETAKIIQFIHFSFLFNKLILNPK